MIKKLIDICAIIFHKIYIYIELSGNVRVGINFVKNNRV